MVHEQVQYQGKAGFFKLNFQNGSYSQITGKCELGGFSLRQSHIICLTNNISVSEWQIQHKVKPSAVLDMRPHPEYSIFAVTDSLLCVGRISSNSRNVMCISK